MTVPSRPSSIQIPAPGPVPAPCTHDRLIVTLSAWTSMPPRASTASTIAPGVVIRISSVWTVRVTPVCRHPVLPAAVSPGVGQPAGPVGVGVGVGGTVVGGGVVAGGVVGAGVVVVGVGVGVGDAGGVGVGDPDGLGEARACTHCRSHVLSAAVRAG
jgi:hypothetical protein